MCTFVRKRNEHLPTCARCRTRWRSRCHILLDVLQRQTGRRSQVLAHRFTSSWRTLRHAHVASQTKTSLCYSLLTHCLAALLLAASHRCVPPAQLTARPRRCGSHSVLAQCRRAAFKSPFLLCTPQRCQERTEKQGGNETHEKQQHTRATVDQCFHWQRSAPAVCRSQARSCLHAITRRNCSAPCILIHTYTHTHTYPHRLLRAL